MVLLSSMHHEAAVDVKDTNKPEIILQYNKTKSRVDGLDHLVGLYSCKRKTHRWPMTVLQCSLLCMCCSTCRLDCGKPRMEPDNTHKRWLFLRELYENLIEEQLQHRYPQGMQVHVSLHSRPFVFSHLQYRQQHKRQQDKRDVFFAHAHRTGKLRAAVQHAVFLAARITAE